MALLPRPVCLSGSDGDRSRANTLSFLLSADPLWLRPIPQRRRVGASKRDASYALRRRKIGPDHLRLIASLSAQGRALCEIAAEVGVSHETVRAMILREGKPAPVSEPALPHKRMRGGTGDAQPRTFTAHLAVRASPTRSNSAVSGHRHDQPGHRTW